MEDSSTQQSYAAVLADIENRIAELQKAAATVRALMGSPNVDISGGNDVGQGGGSARPLVQRVPAGGDALSLVKIGDFFGKSWTEAAREFLRRAGEAQTTVTILNAMRKAQFPMKAKNPSSSLYTSLKRHNGFRLVTRNTWGLADWYPGVEKPKPEPQLRKRSRGQRSQKLKAVDKATKKDKTPEGKVREKESLFDVALKTERPSAVVAAAGPL